MERVLKTLQWCWSQTSFVKCLHRDHMTAVRFCLGFSPTAVVPSNFSLNINPLVSCGGGWTILWAFQGTLQPSGDSGHYWKWQMNFFTNLLLIELKISKGICLSNNIQLLFFSGCFYTLMECAGFIFKPLALLISQSVKNTLSDSWSCQSQACGRRVVTKIFLTGFAVKQEAALQSHALQRLF